MLFLQGYFITAIGKETKTACKHESLTLLPRSHVLKKKKKVGHWWHVPHTSKAETKGPWSQPA